MPKRMTPEELKRFALLRKKMQDENKNKSPKEQLSFDQIDRKARESVKMGDVNEYGYIVGEKWNSTQQKNR